ncbi:MAG TPA: chemotaxis response regulator protein-glutamate methylesterase [Bacillus bacterium]|nr:chemotaxis response regulator protein-glutamate methylesterase [Bacillus sp. (in: firmicutes)]
MTNQVKVLVVDDSAFMRKLITDFLSADSRFHVVGTARNGKDAIEKVKEWQPDVVTLDVEMPEMNGLEALRVIMSDYPTRVVMLSTTTQQGADNTLQAIANGAVDFIAKPSGAISLDLERIKDEIIQKVLMASKANIQGISHKNNKVLSPVEEMKPTVTALPRNKNRNKQIVCIGTSTGGPRALQQVLTKLPPTINSPIVVVQHMPAGFTKSLAVRLNSISDIIVKEAENGDILENGTAYIAPGGYHLKLKEMGNALSIYLDQSEPLNGHRPSVDAMYDSISRIKNYRKIAVIMTGMGSDGTKGLIALKSAGNTIAIAESEETSVVFGMPKSAIATDLVDEVVNLEKIAPTIMKYIDA